MTLRERYKLRRIRKSFVTARKTFDTLAIESDARMEAAQLEARFISESLKRINEGFEANHVSRDERKRFFRKLIKGIDV